MNGEIDYWVDGEIVGEDKEPVVGLPALYVKKNTPESQVNHNGEAWYRRQMVSVLLSRHLSPQEISDELWRLKVYDMDKGEPWPIKTINSDITAIVKEWKKSSGVTVQQHVNEMLAEINEVKRTAWKQLDIQTVLLALDREAKLLGLYAPTAISIITNERIKELAEANGLDAEEVLRVATALAKGEVP